MPFLTSKHPFYSANDYYRETFGRKLVRLSFDGGFTCPNRDGTLSKEGCVFCSEAGSGDFASSRVKSIEEQYADQIELISDKWKDCGYIAYLQAYTNTYAPVECLRKLYFSLAKLPNVYAIAIATRPDCLESDKIALLSELNKAIPVIVELGLQTSDEKTAVLINRCYTNEVYEKAVFDLKNIGVHVITHLIVGLPFESFDTMCQSLDYAVKCGTNGVKLQLLHVLKGTKLSKMYEEGIFEVLSFEEYITIITELIKNLPPDIVVHRITGDGNRDKLVAPLWSRDKRKVLNTVHKTFAMQGTYQGVNKGV